MTSPKLHDMRDEAQKRAQAVKNVAESAAALVEEKLPEKIDRAVMAVIQQRSAEDAYDKGHRAGLDLGFERGKAAKVWHALAFAMVVAGVSVLATVRVYEGAGLWGATIERGKASVDELKQMEDAR